MRILRQHPKEMFDIAFEQQLILASWGTVFCCEDSMPGLLYAGEIRENGKASSHKAILHARRVAAAAIVAIVDLDNIHMFEGSTLDIIDTLACVVRGADRLAIEVIWVFEITPVIAFRKVGGGSRCV